MNPTFSPAITLLLLSGLCSMAKTVQKPIPDAVKTFFSSHCVECHGPDKSKGKVTLHDIGSLSAGQHLELWSEIRDVLEAGEMPPEDEEQPNRTDRNLMVEWITESLRTGSTASEAPVQVPGTRRLTNIEYQTRWEYMAGGEKRFQVECRSALGRKPVSIA